MARKIPRQWVNMQTGEITLEALQYLDDLENGTDADNPSIGTVLAGVNSVTATTTAIVAGTQPLADVLITGLGSLTQIDTAQNENIVAASNAASAGALTASPSLSSLYSEAPGPGAITTDITTIAASGGTPAYSYAWTKVSGTTFTISAPSAASTDFVSPSIFPGSSRSAIYRCTVTDSLAATFVVDVAITVVSPE